MVSRTLSLAEVDLGSGGLTQIAALAFDRDQFEAVEPMSLLLTSSPAKDYPQAMLDRARQRA